MVQVSIVVLTYNADPGKLRQTLAAAAAQREIDFEIIVSDDGSAQKDFAFLDSYMQSLGVKNYRLVENPENKGTVRNCLSGVYAATGEYVFLTSPGDLIYDAYTMRDFYRFAKQSGAKLCFGNSVFYCVEDGAPRLTRQYGMPANPQIYAENTPLAKLSFMSGNWVIGASYFRQREFAQQYLEKIADTSIFMEDTTSTAFALADGIPLRYFDRNIVWYGDGSGISTGASDKWQKRLGQDLRKSFKKMKGEHPQDACVDIAYHNITEENRRKRIAYKLFRHPVLMARMKQGERKFRKVPISCPQEDRERLKKMVSQV